jgi:hypothetical protein
MGVWKIGKSILFRDKHWIIRPRFRFSHRRPGRKDIRFEGAIFSLSLLFEMQIIDSLIGQNHINNCKNIQSYNAALLNCLSSFIYSYMTLFNTLF